MQMTHVVKALAIAKAWMAATGGDRAGVLELYHLLQK